MPVRGTLLAWSTALNRVHHTLLAYHGMHTVHCCCCKMQLDRLSRYGVSVLLLLIVLELELHIIDVCGTCTVLPGCRAHCSMRQCV